MRLTRQESKTLGTMTKVICPKCEIKKLMINAQGLTWCAGVYCRYGFEELKLFFWHKHRKND